METPAPPATSTPPPPEALQDCRRALKSIQDGTIDGATLTRRERLPIVAWMRARGYTRNEIAATFSIHRDTVRRDWREIERTGLREMGALNVRAIGFGYVSRFQAQYEEAMRVYRLASEEKDFTASTAALREARRTLDAMKKTLQDLGLLYREPDRVQVEVLARNLFVERLALFAEVVQDHVPVEARAAFQEDLNRRLDFPVDPAGGNG